jgi:hypothetical protein
VLQLDIGFHLKTPTLKASICLRSIPWFVLPRLRAMSAGKVLSCVRQHTDFTVRTSQSVCNVATHCAGNGFHLWGKRMIKTDLQRPSMGHAPALALKLGSGITHPIPPGPQGLPAGGLNNHRLGPDAVLIILLRIQNLTWSAR